MKRQYAPLFIFAALLIGSIVYFEGVRNRNHGPAQVGGNGVIEAVEIDMGTSLAGRILKIPVYEGNPVKKGEIITRIDDAQLAAKERAAQSALKMRTAEYKRVKALFASGGISRSSMDQAETALTAAKSNLEVIRSMRQEAVLRAPRDAVVLTVNADEGEMAFPGMSIITLADLEHMWMKIYVPQTMLSRVHLGQKAVLKLDSGETFTGHVSYVSKEAEFTPKTIQVRQERTKLVFAVKISVNNVDGILKPGMPAEGRLIEK